MIAVPSWCHVLSFDSFLFGSSVMLHVCVMCFLSFHCHRSKCVRILAPKIIVWFDS